MTDWFETKCWKCGEPYCMTKETERVLRRSRGTFYCPFGHGAVFAEGPSEADKLRQERDRLMQNAAYMEDLIRRERDLRKATERQASAFKGVATRIKNRVQRGVCPCCNRTFADLQRHMATKHAGYIAEPVVPEGATVQ